MYMYSVHLCTVRHLILKLETSLYIYDSKYCSSPVTTLFYLLGSRYTKPALRANFLLFHKTGIAGKLGLENMVGGLGLPILSFLGMSVITYHFRNMGLSLVMLQTHFIISLVVSNADRLWLFQSVLTAYNVELVSPNTEHDLIAANIRSGRRRGSISPWFSAFGVIVITHFSSPVTMQCRNTFFPLKLIIWLVKWHF